MKNKTTNKFRLKEKIARQTFISVDRPTKQFINIPSQQQHPQPFIRHGFSAEYLSLARRFKIKLIPDKFRSNRINSSQQQESGKVSKLRLKTQMARQPKRYRVQQFNSFAQSKPQSVSIQQSNPINSRQNHTYLFFNMQNRKTAYSMQFPNRVNKDLHLLNEPPGIKIKLNSKIHLMGLGNHCKKIFNVRASLQNQEFNGKDVVKQIKLYVLREEQCSVAKLDKSFDDPAIKKQIKKLIILQRMALISMVCNFMVGKLQDHLQQSDRVLEMVLGFWYQIINNTYRDNIYELQTQHSQIRQIMKMLSDARLLTKSSLPLLIETLLQKLPILLKNFKQFYDKIKYIISLSQQLSINRAFYELLTQFAIFINTFESKHQINIDSFSFFATCPSPYLIKPSSKAKSLVVDLDGTLLYTKIVDKALKKHQTLYRPGCYQFIQELSKHYEIIVFTTSMESYARDVTKNFKNIDHFLFRQHAVRVKHGFIKDLNRIGRDLNKVIILDDLSSNFKLQKDNGMTIKNWKGQSDDNQLEKIKEVLIKTVQSKAENVKSELNTYRGQLEKKKVSFNTSPILQHQHSHKHQNPYEMKSGVTSHRRQQIKKISVISSPILPQSVQQAQNQNQIHI